MRFPILPDSPSPTDGQTLVYDDVSKRWVPATASGGGSGTSDHAALTNRDAADQHPIGAVTGLQSALDGKAATSHTHPEYAPATQAINAQTGTSYTLVAADAGRVVTAANASPVTVTVPATTFTAGQRVDVLQSGAGSVTLAAEAGMTLHGTPSLVTRDQWSAVSVLFLSATEGVVIGDLAAP